ncbi:MAG: hypothetical protein IPH44_18765 [Myxococcales bacterium]|nr:hypothetical protein [Myxococcales bacterium]MBK7197272.1 hypothetical protein [Myxococcales bacterium]MBP6845444.1 hypothetical protein [Kofleriaceae bacterium]
MTTIDWHVPGQRVEELHALSVEQRAELRVLASRSVEEAAECLEMLLKRWRSNVLRAYVREVLLGGADHDAWTAQHARWPDPVEELAATVGRPLAAAELAVVDGIAALRDEHIALAREIDRRVGWMAAAKYLCMVVSDLRPSAAMVYVEDVSCRGKPHDAWVRARERSAP